MTANATSFRNRRQAGLLLSERLRGLKMDDPVVYGLPRGGVPIAYEVAKGLHCPLDLVFVHKIGAPGATEVAAAAVAEGSPPIVVRNEDAIRMTRTTEDYIERETGRALAEIGRQRQLYLNGRQPVSPRGRTAVVVDDGLATGATAIAAVRGLRARGAKQVVLAAPVGSPGALDRLAWEADAVICPIQPQNFRSVGEVYADFHQVDDAEVMALLGEFYDAAAAPQFQLP